MSRNSCKGCEYSQKCELVKMTKEERKRREEIEEEIKKYIGGNKMIKDYIHEVTAIQYTGVNRDEIKEFLGKGTHHYEGVNLVIEHDEGDLVLDISDYLIMEKNGKVYGLEDVEFKELYTEITK